ncbi:hypothetical protein IFM89_014790 [Coptis chinensis]|uniref:Protein argonaute N-terminal domain-containing protein n=1 Tax=Coptis chinensis TaxID=261450 RepID=A0A835M046_9MAGN|nr:hypothetical protein IFM89_014790 [Coptis chinensis]
MDSPGADGADLLPPPPPLTAGDVPLRVDEMDTKIVKQIALFYEDDRPVDGKGIGRKVIDKLHETYDTELGGKHFATAGNGSPGGSRSPNGSDRKRFRRPYQSKSFKVQISYAVKIPMKSIASALRGQESENSQEAYSVLDIILRQNAAKKYVNNIWPKTSLIHQLLNLLCILVLMYLFTKTLHAQLSAIVAQRSNCLYKLHFQQAVVSIMWESTSQAFHNFSYSATLCICQRTDAGMLLYCTLFILLRKKYKCFLY